MSPRYNLKSDLLTETPLAYAGGVVLFTAAFFSRTWLNYTQRGYSQAQYPGEIRLACCGRFRRAHTRQAHDRVAATTL